MNSALQNKASRSDETLSSPRVHSPRSDFSLTRAKSSGGFNRLGVIHNQFSAALPNPTPSNANTPNSIPDQKAQNQQAKGQKDSNDEVTSENEVITIPMPTRRQSSNTLHHQVISHANANVSTQTSSSSSLQNNSNIIPESNKEILHMEAAWLEFMNEVRKQVKSNTDEDTKQKEILEIQNKTQEIEKLKAKILELSATLLEEEKLIEKFENENNELQVKILDYQLMALKK